jgi:uncharacterized membrane protein YqiK
MPEFLIGVAVAGVVILLLVFLGASAIFGVVLISANEVGIVTKTFDPSGKKLPAGKQIALKGEPGIQADTLAPGLYFWYWSWMYRIDKVLLTNIPAGEIGLVLALDGSSIPPERILGKVVPCDNFQDARKFLENGGEKGRQLGILTAGKYRINTKLFTVITAANAPQHGMRPEDLLVHRVAEDTVGIITTFDGKPIDEGEIAGLFVPGHDNFQNAQLFINSGGRRGLQEQVLLSGSWNLNPWFVRVEQVPMTAIPIGYVGVVISFVGKAHEDISGVDFKHGDLVHEGHKGVWAQPLYPGKHPLNSRVMKVEHVPTTNIVLNWANRTEAHNYDARLDAITVRSKDGFAFDLEVAQIIHVGALDAPKVISRVGSVQNLVDHVLQPTVGNYFRNAAQAYTVLDFLSARSERQVEAARNISSALRQYDVEAIDTLIGNINPPEALMQTLTDRKIAEEQKKTYEVQQEAQTQRQQLVRETAIADIQQEIVKAERGVNIAELQANAEIKQATGEAEAIRLRASGEAESIRVTGDARAEAYRAGAEALGQYGYTAVQLMQIIGERGVQIVPEISVSGGAGASGGLSDALMAMLLRGQALNTTNGSSVPATKE